MTMKTPVFTRENDPFAKIREKFQQIKTASTHTLPIGSAVAGYSRKPINPGESEDFSHSADNVIWGTSPNIKTAVTPGGSDFGSNVSFFPPLWFSPLMSWVHFYMPRDIKTTYTWIRHWDTFHPLVGNAIDLHTQLPLSRFALKVNDPYIELIYRNMMDMLGGLLLLYDMVREYWLFGEVFGYLYWDDSVGMFTDIQILPPEDVIIEGNYFARNIYLNTDSIHMDPSSQIDRVILEKAPELLNYIKQKKPIPLDPFYVIMMQRKQSPYFNRGQSIVLRAMKDLIYNDKLREAQYAIAQRHITPKEIWTIGNDTYPATETQIDELRDLVQRAGQSPLFTLFTNHTVKVEYVGANGKFINFQAEYEMIEKNILSAMFTNKALTHGEGPCVSEDTLILTDIGFLTREEAIEHVVNGGKIAQYNPETDRVEYVKPLGYKEQEYDGELVHIKSSVVDHLVTPNHKVWYSFDGENWEKGEVRNVIKTGRRFRFKVFGEWVGDEVDYLVIGGKKVDMRKFLQFLGYYIGDGYLQFVRFRNKSIEVPVEIRITQQPSNKGYGQLKELMDYFQQIGFEVIHRDWLKKQDWVILDVELAKIVYKAAGAGHQSKFIHPDIKNLSPVLLDSLVKALLNTDSYYHEDKNFWEYYTTSLSLANDIVEVALKVGYSARYSVRRRKGRKPLYRIILSNNERGKLPEIRKQHIRKVPYKGIVYSFGVPSGLIIVMRNGKVVITGNTYANASVAMRVLMGRYLYVRGLLESVLLQNIFLPVAVAHEFFEITEAELSHGVRRPFSERKPILPEFDWKHKANLLDDTSVASLARQLKDMGFSHKVVCDLLGIDYEEDKYWREKEEGTVFDPLYEEWRKQVAENVPAPVGTEHQSSIKLPVVVSNYKVSKETTEPKVREIEFTWVNRGNLLTKKRVWELYIKPYVEKKQPVPAKVVGKLKPARPGSPSIVELEALTEDDIKELEKLVQQDN